MCSCGKVRLSGFIVFAIAMFIGSWAMCGEANAEYIGTLVGIEKEGIYPDLCSMFIGGSYILDAGTDTGTLYANGYATSLGLSKTEAHDINVDSDQSFYLEVSLMRNAPTPMPVASGTVTVSGTVSFGGQTYEGNLLTGHVQAFGSLMNTIPGASPTVFDFEFLVTGGALADFYGGADVGRAGIIFYPSFDSSEAEAFNGGFQNEFTFFGDLNGTADIVPVPEPSSAGLALTVATAVVVGIVRRRSWMKRGSEN